MAAASTMSRSAPGSSSALMRDDHCGCHPPPVTGSPVASDRSISNNRISEEPDQHLAFIRANSRSSRRCSHAPPPGSEPSGAGAPSRRRGRARPACGDQRRRRPLPCRSGGMLDRPGALLEHLLRARRLDLRCSNNERMRPASASSHTAGRPEPTPDHHPPGHPSPLDGPAGRSAISVQELVRTLTS